MGKFEQFNEIRAGARRTDRSVDNLAALGLPKDTRSVHILWMYPDVLNLHGSRGDAMALLHISNLLGLPCTLRRCNTLTEEIPFQWADLIFFPSGDLSCMEDVNQALTPHQTAFQRYAEAGKVILAFGSSGALLAESTVYLNGSRSRGLGLLDMELSQRKTVFGDDLWLEVSGGPELIGTQIQLADVTLRAGQAPFASVQYGRGNDGTGHDGARTNNVIFTHALGAVLTKNPAFTAYVLALCAGNAGLDAAGLQLSPADIQLELQALADVRDFIQKKQTGEIR